MIKAEIINYGNENILAKTKEWKLNFYEKKILNQKELNFYENKEFSIPFYKNSSEKNEIHFSKFALDQREVKKLLKIFIKKNYHNFLLL